ncbi:hypothetical protein [Maribacter antarcticus]|uniref:hypothetical protein n=1 Tax=Maribacter antarcticus TaxID=505250 RepID=UPI001FE1520E|nr:hypothetical protein [Maribacter antarcticus]
MTKKYTVSLKEGHHKSCQKTKNRAYIWLRRNIEGDTQGISNAEIKFSEETLKQISLSMYICSYRYNGKEYNFIATAKQGF